MTRDADVDVREVAGHVRTAPHEFTVNYNFDEHGLSPYFAADRAVKDHGGSVQTTFEHGEESWRATLYYQESSIVHPGDTLPTGRRFQISNLREFRLSVEPTDDAVGQRGFNAHLRPRWDSMEAKRDDGSRVDIPVPFEEGVNVRISGSNVEFDQYLSLLQQAAQAVGIRRDYFGDPHQSSNVQDAARYVRLHRDVSGPVHARDGPIASMGHLLENDRDGYRKVVQNDRDEHNNNLPGYYHTATLGPQRVREAFPDHAVPKEVKHYYAREAAQRAPGDPLAHPKVEVAYQVSRWDRTVGVDPEDLDRLHRELDETLLSTLADAGIDVCPGGDTYVEDAYFEAETADVSREVVDLEFTRIRTSQESVVIEHVADGLSPVEWETLETLVTDGGDLSPADIADREDRHLDTVYAALDRLDDLVSREYGSVSLRSHHVADLVHQAVEEARQSTRRAVETAGKALEAAKRGRENMSTFVAWASSHGINFREGDEELRIDFGTVEADSHQEGVDEIRRKLRDGIDVWRDAGLDEAQILAAEWRACIEYPRFEGGLQSDVDVEVRRDPTTGFVGGTLR